MRFIKVPGTNLLRDINSMGLSNQDVSGFQDYKTRRKMLQTQRDEINKLKSDINSVKDELSEIKSLMLRLLDKG
jgi:hypothetical protein